MGKTSTDKNKGTNLWFHCNSYPGYIMKYSGNSLLINGTQSKRQQNLCIYTSASVNTEIYNLFGHHLLHYMASLCVASSRILDHWCIPVFTFDGHCQTFLLVACESSSCFTSLLSLVLFLQFHHPLRVIVTQHFGFNLHFLDDK